MIRVSIRTTIVLLAVAAPGCGLAPGESILSSREWRFKGYVGVKSPIHPHNFSYVELDQVSLDGPNEEKIINERRLIQTREILRFDVDRPRKYSFLLGRHITGPQSAEIALAKFHRSMPTVNLSCGWVYLTGYHPVVETRWVTAGSDSSAIVVEIRPGDVARFFLLSGSTSWFERPPGSARVMGPAPGHFIDIPVTGVVMGPTLISADLEANRFIEEVVRPAAEVAEIDW